MSKENYNPNCPCCQSSKIKQEEAEQEEKQFYHEGNVITFTVKRFNDGFYEIVKGKFKGNLVHIFDLVKQNSPSNV